ncbi:MAG TPA: protein kinase [Herpetosiphonaceae bacterium]
MPDPLIGRQLGKFLIQQEIGRGGMARVYRALDTVLQRPVALKVLAPTLSADPEFARRFEREAITAANLRHPAIVTIFDVGEADGLHYIAMEYIGGRTLSAVLEEQGKLGIPLTIAIVAPVAEALDFAHQNGMVHRDVKPHNIMLDTDGRVLLTDFGIAIDPSEGGERLTRTGIFMGTPEYISPEQAQAQPLGGRSDLYSLGIVTYEMLAGQVPFSGGTAQQIMAHVYQAPPPLSSIDPNNPPELDQIFARVLAKDPNQRFERAGNLVEALRFVARRYGLSNAGRDDVAALAIPRNSSAGQATVAMRTPASGYPAPPVANQPTQPVSQRPTPAAAFPIADVFGGQPAGRAQPVQNPIGQSPTTPMGAAGGAAVSGAAAGAGRGTTGGSARQATGRGNTYPNPDDRFVPPPRVPRRRTSYDDDGGSNMSWTLLALGAVAVVGIILAILLARGANGLFAPEPSTNPFTPQATETPQPTVTAQASTPTFEVPTLVQTVTIPPEELPTVEPTIEPTPEPLPPTEAPTPEPTPEPPTPTIEPPTPTIEPTSEPTPTLTPTEGTALPTSTAIVQPTPTGVTGTVPTPVGGSGRVAYFGNDALSVLDLASQQPESLSYPQDPIGPVSISPDGSTLLFDIIDPKTNIRQIAVAERGSNTVTLLTDGASDSYHPSWRGDGLAIVYASKENGSADLYIMDADGQNKQQITTGTGDDQYPSFSPNGTRILFESNRDGFWAIFTVDPQGGPVERVSTLGQTTNDRSPRWSPDGQRIAFASDRDYPNQRTEIYIRNLDGTPDVKVTDFKSGSANGPAWSPDGTLLAFFGDRAGNNDIYIVDLTTDTLLGSPAADPTVNERWPSWGK